MSPPRKYIATQTILKGKCRIRKVLNLLIKKTKCLFGNCFPLYCVLGNQTQIAILDDVEKMETKKSLMPPLFFLI